MIQYFRSLVLKNSKTFVIPQWTYSTIFYVALLNLFFGKIRIDIVYVLILMAGTLSHERKSGSLNKLPTWTFYLIQIVFWIIIVSGVAISIYENQFQR